MRASRRQLLGGVLAGLGLGLVSRKVRAAEEHFLLVYHVKGGWDPSFVFDPHFGSAGVEGDPDSTLSTLNGIAFADADSRPSVRRFFDTWGAQTAVINGFHVGSISHDSGTRLLLTGERGFGGTDLCTRIAAASGAELQVPHAVVEGPCFPGEHGALVSFFDSTSLAAAAGTSPSLRDNAREARLQAWLAAEGGALPAGDAQAEAWRSSLARLPALQAFAAGQSTEVSFEGQRVALIRALFEQGLSRTAILAGEVPPLTQWDSHVDNYLWQDACYELLFSNLSGLCGALAGGTAPDGSSLLARTRILVVSEMGRQPIYNAQLGKDHWPTTSAMLIGAGVAGGRVYGATDEGLVARGLNRDTGEADDGAELFDAGALAATLAMGFDVDPAELAPGSAPLTAIWA